MSVLRDDCFAFDDKHRMKHATVLATLAQRLSQVVGDEQVPLSQAAGRILAQPCHAQRDTPASDNAAVDGYAFRHHCYTANEGALRMCGAVKAGQPSAELSVPDGGCVRIFTGAPMPPGLDTVAMQEDCITHSDTVTIPKGLKPGANRRKAGEDVRARSIIVPARQCLRATDIAALAAAGIASVTVRQRLRIGLVSTGDEVVQPGAQAQAHQVFDANRPMLHALLDRPYAQIIDLGHCNDDPALLRKTLSDAAKNCDLIVTSGGASRGQEDHLFDTLAQLGHAHVWQIAIKPGRPMLFGQFDNTVLMALPGNPVAAMVCCLLYGRAMIAHLCGAQWTEPHGYLLPSAFSIENKKTDRREFLRSWRVVDPETGIVSVQKFERDGSGLISGLQAAEGLTVLPETVASVKQGETVRFVPFSDMEL